MNDESQILIAQFANELTNKMFELFFQKFANRKIERTKISDIIINAHFTSMYNCISKISENDKILHEDVKKFIDDLRNFVE
jgi:hypothetical protein